MGRRGSIAELRGKAGGVGGHGECRVGICPLVAVGIGAPGLELDAHFEGEEQVGGAGSDAHGLDADVLQQPAGFVLLVARLGRAAGEGEVVVERDAPGTGERELGAVLERETPEVAGRLVYSGAELAGKMFGDEIGGGGRHLLEPGAEAARVEPVKQPERQQQVKETQRLAHERSEIAGAIDERGERAGSDEERPEENEDAAPVLTSPVMPEEEQFHAATED